MTDWTFLRSNNQVLNDQSIKWPTNGTTNRSNNQPIERPFDWIQVHPYDRILEFDLTMVVIFVDRSTGWISPLCSLYLSYSYIIVQCDATLCVTHPGRPAMSSAPSNRLSRRKARSEFTSPWTRNHTRGKAKVFPREICQGCQAAQGLFTLF